MPIFIPCLCCISEAKKIERELIDYFLPKYNEDQRAVKIKQMLEWCENGKPDVCEGGNKAVRSSAGLEYLKNELAIINERKKILTKLPQNKHSIFQGDGNEWI